MPDEPLRDLCRDNKLFEVQEWIAAGKPVNPPPIPCKGNQPRSPLRIAIELGFHSPVLVPPRGGAAIEPDSWSGAMGLALRKKGARWAPRDKGEIAELRQALIKLAPEYAAEFVLVMARCGGCSKADVVELIRTPAMKARLKPLVARLEKIISNWPSPTSP